MSEIKKIQVDGVVYDLTASGEEFESQIKDLDNKVNDLDAKVDSEIQKEADRVDEKINQLNESTNASINDLTTNISEVETSVEAEKQAREEADTKLQQSIDAITGAAEDVVKYQEFEYQGVTRKTIQLANYDSISGIDTKGNGHNLIMLSKWDKADVGSANVQLNLNSTGRPQVNDTEEVAYVSDMTNVVKETVGEDGRKTIYLDNHENICGYMPDGQTAVNIAMVSKWGKVDMGSTSVELNLNGLSDHPTYNDTEKIALLKDLEGATAEDIKALEEKVDGIDTKVDNLNTTVVDSNSAINTRIDEETAKLNTRIDSEVLPEISELDKNKVGYFEADKNGIKTKNILLDNYASVLGKDTEGTAHNLIMLSKWNKADVGASGVELNFNGSQTRPTYNDDKELALLEDINGTAETINLVKKDDLTYELEVGDRIAGTISIPKDQFLKSVEYLPDTKELKFVFETTEGEQTSNIDISDLVDTYVAGNGLKLEENKFSINLDPATEAYLEVSESGIKLVGIDKALADKANTSDLVNVVKYQDFELNGDKRKTIQLANYDSITGVTTTGSGVNIAMVSKWNKVDLGSAQVEINLNGSAEHPTYNDAEQLAFVKDVENAVSDKVTSQELQAAKEELSQNFNTAIQGEKERAEAAEESLKNSIDSYINPLQESIVDIQGIISVLSGKLTLLENKVDMLQTAASEDVPSFDGSSPINDSAKMYEVSNGTITNTNTITAKNIVLNDSSLSNNARLSVLADGSEFNNFSISGDFPKDNGGNAVVKINNSKNVSFTGLTFDSSNIYNGIEIGLSSSEDKLPNNVLFDNCKFTGSFTNNAILIFGTSDDAVITLNNCSFESVSNALRLSNKSNAKNITVNIVNCTIDKWDSNPMWAGFLIFEDYTSKTPEEIATNNLFGDGKIKVNFVNLMHNGVKVLPKDLSKVCGTQDENQVVYICQDNAEGGIIAAYDESIYPVITFK